MEYEPIEATFNFQGSYSMHSHLIVDLEQALYISSEKVLYIECILFRNENHATNVFFLMYFSFVN